MSLNLKLWWKGLKNTLECKWLRIRGKLEFPWEIIPRKEFKGAIDFDKLANEINLYLTRHSDLTREDAFNDLGMLRKDVILPKEIPLMSLNLLGGLFKPEHTSIKIGKKGSAKWTYSENIFLNEFLDQYEIRSKGCVIYIHANSIHAIPVPYTQPVSPELKKEVKAFFSALPASTKIGGVDYYQWEGQVKLVHDPTKLNYWHFEYNIFDYKGSPVKPKSSAWIETLCEGILNDIISINCSASVPNIAMIPKYHYVA